MAEPARRRPKRALRRRPFALPCIALRCVVACCVVPCRRLLACVRACPLSLVVADVCVSWVLLLPPSALPRRGMRSPLPRRALRRQVADAGRRAQARARVAVPPGHAGSAGVAPTAACKSLHRCRADGADSRPHSCRGGSLPHADCRGNPAGPEQQSPREGLLQAGLCRGVDRRPRHARARDLRRRC